jgi:hypothetical protein
MPDGSSKTGRLNLADLAGTFGPALSMMMMIPMMMMMMMTTTTTTTTTMTMMMMAWCLLIATLVGKR